MLRGRQAFAALAAAPARRAFAGAFADAGIVDERDDAPGAVAFGALQRSRSTAS